MSSIQHTLVAVWGLGVGWVSDLFEVSPLSKQSFCPSAPNSGPKHGKTVKSEKRILPFTLLRFYAEKRILRFYAVTPAMQQMMLQMMQSQQTMLEMLNKRMDAEEKRRKDQEAAQAAVVNPFGPGGTAVGSPTHGGSSGSVSAPVVSAPSTSGVGSNRAEKYLPSLPLIEHGHMNKGRVKELEEYHRWLEVLASWLALIDDNYVGELRQALVHDTDIKLLRTKNGFTLLRFYGRVARFYAFTVLRFYAFTQQQAAGADGRARVKR